MTDTPHLLREQYQYPDQAQYDDYKEEPLGASSSAPWNRDAQEFDYMNTPAGDPWLRNAKESHYPYANGSTPQDYYPPGGYQQPHDPFQPTFQVPPTQPAPQASKDQWPPTFTVPNAGVSPTVPLHAPPPTGRQGTTYARRWMPTTGNAGSQFATTDSRPAHRFTKDDPPEWDGRDPGANAEQYLKRLYAWLVTTRTVPEQQGLLILDATKQGSTLYTLLNEFTIDQLTAPTAGRMLYEHIRSIYREYIEQALPKRIEENFYSSSARRQKGETILTYTSRKTTLFNQLHSAGCALPEEVKGYILLRDAFLNAQAWDTLQTWNGNTYDY